MSSFDVPHSTDFSDAESLRLLENSQRRANWQRWGPYLSERQWGTVREDYSLDGNCWSFFPHDHARSRAYRWGEDGLLGIADRQGRLCLALALWNEQDPILKERLFGLSGPEGNHGEDVKEEYYYLDSTPTHSYLQALYKYPHAEFPYRRLIEENRSRGKNEREFELVDSGVFADNRYFDITVEYAKAAPNDILMQIVVCNRGPESAPLHILPTLWFRNTWSTGRSGEGYWPKPRIHKESHHQLVAQHATLGQFNLLAADGPTGKAPQVLVTENETNLTRLFGVRDPHPYVKDAFHDYVIHGERRGLHPGHTGTKASFHYALSVPAGEEAVLQLRLVASGESEKLLGAATSGPVGADFAEVVSARRAEADAFYEARMPKGLSIEERNIMRQGYAGLLWSKQFYHYSVKDWLEGDPTQPRPPAERYSIRNGDWSHLYNRDVISMPDKWEYPWYAAWDLAFHMIPFARIDPEFAKHQLLLMLREWYMHPNGQIPAYEFNFSDVNPPVHAWAVWRVYKLAAPRGRRDRKFLASAFHKLLLNFTWWINRKDNDGNHIFSGGFLGLDNIGLFDRSQPSPLGGELDQADGTSWMAFFCGTMLSIALELASEDPSYEDVASKFFEHFVSIADAINTVGETGLWHEEDGFYYDHLRRNGELLPLRVRSLVGLLPMITAEVIDVSCVDRLPGFARRMRWFLENRKDLARQISYMDCHGMPGRLLLAIPSRRRLQRMLRYLLDESEFLSPFGVRSLSKVHAEHPYRIAADGHEYRVSYVPGESDTSLFGGNSNWRGPVWLPMNYLIMESLERYHRFYGDDLEVECPTGSGRMMNLKQVANELSQRLSRLVLSDNTGMRACHGDDLRYARDPHYRNLVLFYEYFHGDTGRGLGASHQTGWSALLLRCLEKLAAQPASSASTG